MAKAAKRNKTSVYLGEKAKVTLSSLKAHVREDRVNGKNNLPEDIEITESAILEALILAATRDYAAAQLKKAQR